MLTPTSKLAAKDARIETLQAQLEKEKRDATRPPSPAEGRLRVATNPARYVPMGAGGGSAEA